MKFDAAVQALTDAGVEFLIIGGWSVILHGSAYLTKDLDIFFLRSADNCRRIAHALAPFHPRLRDLPLSLPFVLDASTLRNGSIFTLDTDLGPVDLLAEVSGLGAYNEVEAQAVWVTAFGREVKTLDLQSLIRSKRAAGRAKDLIAVQELEGFLEASEPQ